MDVQLVSSRDGVEWDRSVYRRPLMLPGLPEKRVFGKELRQRDDLAHYGSRGQGWTGLDLLLRIRQSSQRPVGGSHRGDRNWPALRQDGFVSVDATAEGLVLTRPLQFSGSTLQVNARLLKREGDASTAPGEVTFNDSPNQEGYLKVEVQDIAGNAIPGYESRQFQSGPRRGGLLQGLLGGKGEPGGASGSAGSIEVHSEPNPPIFLPNQLN